VDAQGAEASLVRRDADAARRCLDMPHRHLTVARIEKEERLAVRSVEPPDLCRAVATHKGWCAEGCAQIGLVQAGGAGRLAGGGSGRQMHM